MAMSRRAHMQRSTTLQHSQTPSETPHTLASRDLPHPSSLLSNAGILEKDPNLDYGESNLRLNAVDSQSANAAKINSVSLAGKSHQAMTYNATAKGQVQARAQVPLQSKAQTKDKANTNAETKTKVKAKTKAQHKAAQSNSAANAVIASCTSDTASVFNAEHSLNQANQVNLAPIISAQINSAQVNLAQINSLLSEVKPNQPEDMAMVGSNTTVSPQQDNSYQCHSAHLRVDEFNGGSTQDILLAKQRPQAQLKVKASNVLVKAQANTLADAQNSPNTQGCAQANANTQDNANAIAQAQGMIQDELQGIVHSSQLGHTAHLSQDIALEQAAHLPAGQSLGHLPQRLAVHLSNVTSTLVGGHMHLNSGELARGEQVQSKIQYETQSEFDQGELAKGKLSQNKVARANIEQTEVTQTKFTQIVPANKNHTMQPSTSRLSNKVQATLPGAGSVYQLSVTPAAISEQASSVSAFLTQHIVKSDTEFETNSGLNDLVPNLSGVDEIADTVDHANRADLAKVANIIDIADIANVIGVGSMGQVASLSHLNHANNSGDLSDLKNLSEFRDGATLGLAQDVQNSGAFALAQRTESAQRTPKMQQALFSQPNLNDNEGKLNSHVSAQASQQVAAFSEQTLGIVVTSVSQSMAASNGDFSHNYIESQSFTTPFGFGGESMNDLNHPEESILQYMAAKAPAADKVIATSEPKPAATKAHATHASSSDHKAKVANMSAKAKAQAATKSDKADKADNSVKNTQVAKATQPAKKAEAQSNAKRKTNAANVQAKDESESQTPIQDAGKHSQGKSNQQAQVQPEVSTLASPSLETKGRKTSDKRAQGKDKVQAKSQDKSGAQDNTQDKSTAKVKAQAKTSTQVKAKTQTPVKNSVQSQTLAQAQDVPQVHPVTGQRPVIASYDFDAGKSRVASAIEGTGVSESAGADVAQAHGQSQVPNKAKTPAETEDNMELTNQEYATDWIKSQDMWHPIGASNPATLSDNTWSKHAWPMFGWEHMRSPQRVTYMDVEPRYLELLSSKYPNRIAAFSEIINLQAILNLPKGTEHFVSDIHGEYEAFRHILNNCSGVIKEKVDLLFTDMNSEQKADLCTLIYYPQEVLKNLEQQGLLTAGWYREVLNRLIQLCKYLSAKYTRSKVRKAINRDYAYIIDELLHAQEGESNSRALYHSKIIDTILHIHAAHHFVTSLCALSKRLAVDHLHVVGDIFDRGPHPDQVMALLMDYHSLDIQWGNHDILWMGAACGSEACMATVLRNNINYFNCNLLESAYGISLRKLNDFAQRTYRSPVKELSAKASKNSKASKAAKAINASKDSKDSKEYMNQAAQCQSEQALATSALTKSALSGLNHPRVVGTALGDDVSPEDQIQFIQLTLGYSERKLSALTTLQLDLVYQYALQQMNELTLAKAGYKTEPSECSARAKAGDAPQISSETIETASTTQSYEIELVHDSADAGALSVSAREGLAYNGADLSEIVAGQPQAENSGNAFAQYADTQHATAQALLEENAARSQRRRARKAEAAEPTITASESESSVLDFYDTQAEVKTKADKVTLAVKSDGPAADKLVVQAEAQVQSKAQLQTEDDEKSAKERKSDKFEGKRKKGKKLKALVRKLEAEYAERMAASCCAVVEDGDSLSSLGDSSQERKDKMVKAITVIALKLQGQLILRNPEFNMDDRLLLDKIDLKHGKVAIGDKVYDMNTVDLPTLDPEHPFDLSPEEAEVMAGLKYSFMHSRELQREVNFLFSHGSIYKRFNGNLLYHGCIPMTDDGQFKQINCHGKLLSGKAFLDYCEAVARRAFDEHDERSLDFMYFLWCGINSPLSGRIMKPFERYFIDDKRAHVEPRDPYYEFYYQEATCRKVLSEFNLDPETGHIINGHTPIKVKQGESPIRGNGKLFVIDGGLCSAYHETTGIAGYTLIFSSHGMTLQAHRPFVSTDEAIAKKLDIVSTSNEVEHYTHRLLVANSDTGIKLKRAIFELEALLDAYRQGILPESPTNH